MTAQPAWEPRYATRAARMRASEIRELLKVLEQPGVISFGGGIPDPVLFPVEKVRAAYASVLSTPASAGQVLQYSVSEGNTGLREWIAGQMAALGVPCAPDNIVVVGGSQQGIEFLGKLLLSPNDTALVTAPTYLGALQAFSGSEPCYDTLRPEDGNRTAQSYAEAAAKNGGAVKLAYAVPDFANPTGETLSLAARHRLIELATELDIPLIEDAAYAALRFDGEPLPPLQALDIQRNGSIEQSRVIYCGTFSKTLTPGLRLGWICAATPVIRRLVLIKQAADLNAPAINQAVMLQVASSGYDEQVACARTHYRTKRDAMLAALARHMPPGCTWTKPEGGLFVWVTLPDGIDASALLPRAVKEAKAAYVPGKAFFADGTGANTLRLSYSLPRVEDIEAGIMRLGALLREVIC